MNTEREKSAAQAPPPVHEFALPEPAKLSRGRALTFVVLGVLGLSAVFLVAFLPRRAAQQELARRAAATGQTVSRLTVSPPKLVSNESSLRLPASIQPLEEAVIYARADGYVARWLVDLGDKVKADQVLAEIDTPELTQGLSQARAALAKAQAAKAQAEAGQIMAKSKFNRTGKLLAAGVASQQELEQSQAASAVGDADVNVAQAAIEAELANIRRLSNLQRYSKVLAPFAGTITSRTVDRGSLVTAGNATPLFRLAATDIVRVFVHVPQELAAAVTAGAPAKVSVREFGARIFEGKVARTAGALDPATRTLNTEIQVPNPDGQLLAGMYAEVSLNFSTAQKVYEVPATALLNDAQGLRVAILNPDNTLHLQPIVIQRDLGATLFVSAGLNGDERVVQIASVDLSEGQKVEPLVPVENPSPAPGAK